jgi:hypothetical protein
VASKLREGQALLDLVHILGAGEARPKGYLGLSW